MTDNVLVQTKNREIKLGDGNTYKLSPLNLNVLALLEDELNCNFIELQTKLKDLKMGTLRLLLFALLHFNHPELDKLKVGELVTIENLADVSTIIADIITVKV